MRPGSQDPLGSDEDYLSTGGPATHLGHQVRIGSLADSLDPHSVPALTSVTPLPTIGFPTPYTDDYRQILTARADVVATAWRRPRSRWDDVRR